MLTEKIDLNFAGQVQPYFIFFERELTRNREYFLFKIDHEYGYYLRRVIARYTGMVGTSVVPELQIEFIDPALGQAKQTSPYPLPHITTPNSGGSAEIEVSGQLSVKTAKTSEKILNYYYPYADTIMMIITGGGVINTGYGGTTYPRLWLMIDGYYVPEKSLAIWNKAKERGLQV